MSYPIQHFTVHSELLSGWSTQCAIWYYCSTEMTIILAPSWRLTPLLVSWFVSLQYTALNQSWLAAISGIKTITVYNCLNLISPVLTCCYIRHQDDHCLQQSESYLSSPGLLLYQGPRRSLFTAVWILSLQSWPAAISRIKTITVYSCLNLISPVLACCYVGYQDDHYIQLSESYLSSPGLLLCRVPRQSLYTAVWIVSLQSCVLMSWAPRRLLYTALNFIYPFLSCCCVGCQKVIHSSLCLHLKWNEENHVIKWKYLWRHLFNLQLNNLV